MGLGEKYGDQKPHICIMRILIFSFSMGHYTTTWCLPVVTRAHHLTVSEAGVEREGIHPETKQPPPVKHSGLPVAQPAANPQEKTFPAVKTWLDPWQRRLGVSDRY